MKYPAFLAAALLLSGVACAQKPQNPVNAISPNADSASQKLALPLAQIQQIQAVGAAQSGENWPILRVKLRGQTSEIALPMSADTSIVKDNATSRGSDVTLSVRDNRWIQTLLKPDLSALPKNGEIESAQLEITLSYREKNEGATLVLHQMRADWDESATFFKPRADAQNWNGLKAGEHFDGAPLSSWQTEAATPQTRVVFPDLAPVVTSWRGGAPNFGFLLLMRGRATQIGLGSRERQNVKTENTSAAPNPNNEPLRLGGANAARLWLRSDPAILERVLLRPDDLQSAALRLHFAEKPRGGTLYLHRVLRDFGENAPRENTDFEAAPAISVSLSAQNNGEKDGFLVALSGELARAPFGFLARYEGDGQLQLPALREAATRPVMEIVARKHPNEQLFDHQIFGRDMRPKSGVFTRLQNGHLFYDGQRLRLWGLVGFGDAGRMRRMGFNAQRVWQPTPQVGGGAAQSGQGEFYSFESAKRGLPAPYSPGDGSKLDAANKHFAALKANGMFVMFASLTGSAPIEPTLFDDSFIAGGADWNAWKTAVSDVKDKASLLRAAFYFDERLQKLKKQHAVNLLNHRNPYTGKRYAEDEAIAIFEVWNEQGFLKRTIDNGLNLPPFFQAKAQNQWNEWLRARYKTDAALQAAWGALKDGESLEKLSVELGPSLKNRDQFPAARGADFVRFLIEKVADFERDFLSTCRAQAPTGVGVNVVPFSFDTQYQPSIHWPYSKKNGGVNSFGMYYWDLNSQLQKPPSMYVLDSNRIEGSASVLYETNAGRPGHYRAEYPLRLAALASWQDFDAVFWHYWGDFNFWNDEQWLFSTLDYPRPNFFWTGVQQEDDPVFSSSMAVAGQIFLSGAIDAAPNPVTFRVGKRGIFGLELANGVNAREATFARGSQIRFEPEGDFSLRVEGEIPKQPPGKTLSGEQIVWDWENGRLIVDTPRAKIFAGQTRDSNGKNGHVFRDGFAVSGFSTPFAAWALVSSDTLPLSQTRRAFVSSQWSAQNTGFAFDWNTPGGPMNHAKTITHLGRAPIQTDKVDFTLSLPRRADVRFTGYDFALRRDIEERFANAAAIPVRARDGAAAREIWMGVLELGPRGEAATPVLEAGTPRPFLAQNGTATAIIAGDARLARLYSPIPNLSWGDSYSQVHKALRDAPFVKTSVSPEAQNPAPDATITLTETSAFFGATADLEARFQNGLLRSLTATFKRPPPLEVLVSELEKLHGAPLEKRITGDPTKADVVRWLKKDPLGDVEIALGASQGITTLVFQIERR